MRDRQLVSQYVKNWKPNTPSQTYFTDFAGGGVLYIGSSYKWHIFTSSGTWTAPVTNADVIVVAGGGGGGQAGGGAGGVRNLIATTHVVGTAYTVTIGSAGTNGTTTTSGGNSSIVTSSTTITATGGGKGMSSTGGVGVAGGSGGGAYSTGSISGYAGNSGAFSPVEGFAGSGSGDACSPSPYGPYGKSGGGGGAGGAAVAARTHNNTASYNDDNGGIGGIGVALPTDCIGAPIFDTVKAIKGTTDTNVYVGQGGMGSGYKNANSYYGNPTQMWQGSFAVVRLGFSGWFPQNAISYGCGGSTMDSSRSGLASAGLVIVRYAL